MRRTFLWWVAVGCVAAGLTAGMGGCARRQATMVPEPLVEAHDLGLMQRWSTLVDVPAGAEMVAPVVLGDLLVYVERPTNLLTAIAIRDGGIRWRRHVGSKVDQLFQPFRYNEHIFVNTELELFSLMAEDGELREITKLSQMVQTSPAFFNTYAVYGSVSGRVFAHDVVQGYSKWEYQLNTRIVTPPVLSGDNVLVGDAAGTYALLDVEKGELLWRGRTFARISAAPAAAPQGIFIASEDNNLYAVDKTTGRDRWVFRTTTPLLDPPAAFLNTVYQVVRGQGLVALDGNTGQPIWTNPQVLRPVHLDNQKLICYGQDTLVTLDALSGKVLVTKKIDPIVSVLVVEDGDLIVLCKNGRIVRLDKAG